MTLPEPLAPDIQQLLGLILSWDDLQRAGAKNPSTYRADHELRLRNLIRGLARRLHSAAQERTAQFNYWYLASPYSDPRPHVVEYRVGAVCTIASALVGEGLTVYSPIAHGHALHKLGGYPGTEAEAWRKHNRSLLYHSCGVLVLQLHGYENSKGISLERTWAADFEKPVEPLDTKEELNTFVSKLKRKYS